MQSRLIFGSVILVLWAVAVLLLAPLEARAYDSVRQHQLQCSRNFPCPAELHGRINFWIDVYGRWQSRDSILHDASRPDRVYRVVKGRACGRKGNTAFIKEQKKKIAGELYALANRLERKQKVQGSYGRHLLTLFPSRSPAKIRTAARNIRCQSGNSDGFRAALRRFGIYGPLVRQVLKDAGLPADIQYLPFVESSYNPKAYSRVGAAGLWQIMPATARVLGLELDATVDERLDPEAASWAAARYLKDSRKTLTVAALSRNPGISHGEVSPFVITSYNYGVNGMRRAIKKLGPDFMRVINRYRTRKFQVAVKNFYAGFLAARHVARNAKKFFGTVKQGRPLRYRTLILKRSVSIGRLKSVFRLSESQLKELNPALTRFVWHGWRFVPDGYRLRLPVRSGGWANHVARLRIMPSEIRTTGAVDYTVRRGDTACGIASAFGASCRELIAINRLNRSAVIRVGQKLQVPRAGKPASTMANRGSYVVRLGDSACSIARRFGVDCDDLLASNGIHRGSILSVGRKLLIPGTLPTPPGGSYTVGKGDSVCSIASRHGLTCKALLAANGLGSGDLIFPGQTLTIPGSETAAPLSVKKAAGEVRRTTVSYRVRAGDSACRIAARLGVSCRRLIGDNALGTNAVIHPGQILRVAGVPLDTARALSTQTAAAAPVPSSAHEHRVQAGDTVCAIARVNGLPCAALLSFNGLAADAPITVGQILKIPSERLVAPATSTTGPAQAALTASASEAPASAQTPVTSESKAQAPVSGAGSGGKSLAAGGPATTAVEKQADWPQITASAGSEAAAQAGTASAPGVEAPVAGASATSMVEAAPVIDPLDREIDLDVQIAGINGERVYRINIEPEETLGHYSDWLRLGGVKMLRELNGREATKVLSSGTALLLPVSSETQRRDFERRRQEYHRVLVEEFKENFEVAGIEQYTVRKGDSLWLLAREFELPLWVITRYNPVLRSSAPKAGENLQIPLIRPRQG